MKKRIVIVEDERIVAEDTREILEDLGYDVTDVVPSGEEAIRTVETYKPDIVLMDIILEGEMDGIDAAAEIRRRFDIPVVYVTAYADEAKFERAKKTGPFGYILKPFDERDMRTTIDMALYKHTMDKEVAQSVDRLVRSLDGTVNALAYAVEMRDPYTAGHQKRVATLARAIAKELGFSDDRIRGINLASVIHDVGKINVPAEILSKPGRLTETEFSLIKTHSQAGYDILEKIDFPWPIARIVVQHHERIDGSGYPAGLSGNEILTEVKILSVADVIEAMSSHRPYRPSLGIDRAIEEITRNKGSLFDGDIVDVCLLLLKEKGFHFD